MKQVLGKIKVFLSTKSAMVALSFFGLYLLSTGVSLAVFSFVKRSAP